MTSKKPFGMAVNALVSDEEGNILLVRRSAQSKHFGRQWDLPGGKVDPGETFDAALCREVFEETGFEIEITGFAGAIEYPMPAIRVVMLFFETRPTAGELRLSCEHDDYAWVSRAHLPLRELTAPMRKFLAAYPTEH